MQRYVTVNIPLPEEFENGKGLTLGASESLAALWGIAAICSDVFGRIQDHTLCTLCGPSEASIEWEAGERSPFVKELIRWGWLEKVKEGEKVEWEITGFREANPDAPIWEAIEERQDSSKDGGA